jgi:hypothetical protein
LDASQITLCQLTKAEDRRRSDNDRAKTAHDDLIAAAYRAKADALEIEALAKRRLADEYDAAPERGEVAKAGGERSGRERSTTKPTAADVSLSRKEIHEARAIRDAEKRDPGVVRRTVDRAAVNFAKAPDTRRLPGPDSGLRSLLGQSTAAGQTSAA